MPGLRDDTLRVAPRDLHALRAGRRVDRIELPGMPPVAQRLTRTEAARELGVSSRTVSLAATVAADRGWITAGTGPGARYHPAPA